MEGIQQVVYTDHLQFTATQGLELTLRKLEGVQSHQARKTFWEIYVLWLQM